MIAANSQYRHLWILLRRGGHAGLFGPLSTARGIPLADDMQTRERGRMAIQLRLTNPEMVDQLAYQAIKGGK